MKGLNLSWGWLVLLLLWTLSAVIDAGSVGSAERGGSGRSQKRGGSGGEKRRKLHRIQHGQCSYTFILPELDGCPGGGLPAQTQHYGGFHSEPGVAQRDSPPADSEWPAQKLQQLESTMENNTQWLLKVSDKPPSFLSLRALGHLDMELQVCDKSQRKTVPTKFYKSILF